MPQRSSREFTVNSTVRGRREEGELPRNVRPRITYDQPIRESDIAPQLYHALPVENIELTPGVRALIPGAVARRSTDDLRERRERVQMYNEDHRSWRRGNMWSQGDPFFAFDPDGERTERDYENAQREMQAQMEYWRNALADRTRQEQGGFTDSLRYARVLEAAGSQTQRRERRAEAQQQNTVRNMLNLPTRLMLTDGNVMTTVRREPPVVIEVD